MVFARFASQFCPAFIEHPRQNNVTAQLQSGTSRRPLREIGHIHRIQSEVGREEVKRVVSARRSYQCQCQQEKDLRPCVTPGPMDYRPSCPDIDN